MKKTMKFLRLFAIVVTALLAQASNAKTTSLNLTRPIIQIIALKLLESTAILDNAAVDMAFVQAQSLLDKHADVHLHYVDVQAQRCIETDFVGAIAAEIYYTRNVSVFVGTACSYMLEVLCPMAARWNIPVIAGGGMSDHLGDKFRYSTLTRVSPFLVKTFCASLYAVLRKFHWYTTSLFKGRSPIERLIGQSILRQLNQGNVWSVAEQLDRTSLYFKNILTEFSLQTRGESTIDILCIIVKKGAYAAALGKYFNLADSLCWWFSTN